MVDKNKRIWSVVCPLCGRSYRLSIWDRILGGRLRGILGFGQGFNDAGKWCKPDIAVSGGAELDAAVGAGFFSRLRARLINAIFNWLGNGWLAKDDLRDILNRIGKVRGGFPVASFGPGVAEGGCRRDVARYGWGSETVDIVKSDTKVKVWG